MGVIERSALGATVPKKMAEEKKRMSEKMPDSRSAHTESPRMLCEV